MTATFQNVAAGSVATLVVNFNGEYKAPSPSLSVQAAAGHNLTLPISAPAAVNVTGVVDLQGALDSWTLNPSGSGVDVTIASRQTTASVFALVAVDMVFAESGLPQRRLYKINVTAPPEPKSLVPPAAAIGPVVLAVTSIAKNYNADVGNIFYPESGGYFEPRPATCASRVGIDGYSPWTYTYGQGNKPPHPDLSLVPQDGNVSSALGVWFKLPKPNSSAHNIAFVSQYTNFPTSLNFSFGEEAIPTRAGDVLWLLVAGSTNPMQTRLANARVTIVYADETTPPDSFDLVPPLNYWSLSAIGGADYDYERDAFCLPRVPPPTLQLGENCRAMLLPWKLSGRISRVELQALSLEIVVGLVGASVTRAAAAA